MVQSDNERPERSDNRALDYKTAFYGACVLITVFAGLSWRLFSTDIANNDTARAVIDQDQWVSIRALERQLDGTAREVASIDKLLALLEARLITLEHQGERR